MPPKNSTPALIPTLDPLIQGAGASKMILGSFSSIWYNGLHTNFGDQHKIFRSGGFGSPTTRLCNTLEPSCWFQIIDFHLAAILIESHGLGPALGKTGGLTRLDLWFRVSDSLILDSSCSRIGLQIRKSWKVTNYHPCSICMFWSIVF